MLKVNDGFADMQRELLVKNASQLLAKKKKSESKNKVSKVSQGSAKRVPEDSVRDLIR